MSYLTLMIFHEFPDLSWLKSQVAQGFSNRLGWGNLPLDTEGFPSVIIHTKVRECFRPDIKGPFSFFLNLRGNSFCSVDRQTTRIDGESYLVLSKYHFFAITALSMPPGRVFHNSPDSSLLTRFPFIYLPGLLVPLAYTLHIFSLRQWGIFLNHQANTLCKLD